MTQFSDNNGFKIDYATFKILIKIKKEFEDHGQRDSIWEAIILLVFSNTEWSQLKPEEQKEHTLRDFKICRSKEEYSSLTYLIKSFSIVNPPPGSRNASRKEVIVDKTKEITILILSPAVIAI